MTKITVFTPTYNRSYTLERLYHSLIVQTNKNFEWLIVDDGSTDETVEMIKKFINEKKISIRYCFQENLGKAMAHNCGIKMINTELFTCVDSDDYLTENAVDVILTTWNNITNAIGIVAKRIKPDGSELTIMKNGKIYSTLKEAYDSGNLSGDTFLVYKSSEIRKYQFPHFSGEKFIPEAYLYDKLDQIGKMYLLNEGLYISEYLEDGYTRNFDKVIAHNPNGYMVYLKQRLELDTDFKDRYLDIARIISILFVLKKRKLVNNHRFISLIAYPLGYFLYIKRFKKWEMK
ncbi:MAG: glycosyltransferase family 2 protein [Thomasclavelia sp.]